MSVTLGKWLGGRNMEDVEREEAAAHDRLVAEARLRVARTNDRWTEIPDGDLVKRGTRAAPLFVSARTDHVYTLYRGIVFDPRSASAIADYSPLAFVVDRDGALTFYERHGHETWTQRLERIARRKARKTKRAIRAA